MNFEDGTAFLALTKELIKQAVSPPNQDAKIRSAISRAYYAAFLAARYHLHRIENDQLIPYNSDVHKYVREKFESSLDPVKQDVAKGLNNLRRQRNKADYDASYVVLPSNLQLIIYAADDIFSLLKTL